MSFNPKNLNLQVCYQNPYLLTYTTTLVYFLDLFCLSQPNPNVVFDIWRFFVFIASKRCSVKKLEFSCKQNKSSVVHNPKTTIWCWQKPAFILIFYSRKCARKSSFSRGALLHTLLSISVFNSVFILAHSFNCFSNVIMLQQFLLLYCDKNLAEAYSIFFFPEFIFFFILFIIVFVRYGLINRHSILLPIYGSFCRTS